MMLKRLLCAVLCLLLAMGTLVGCGEPRMRAESFYEYFDTVSVVISYVEDEADVFADNCHAVEDVLRDYHRMFDIYYEYAGINNLKTVNKQAGIAPVAVDARLIDFLLYCKEIYAKTNGRTNIAMGAVLSLWHDERERAEVYPDRAKLPDADALREAALHTDINDLIIDREAGTVYLADPAMRLDVGAIGKGYAAERAAEVLRERGVTGYVLNVGGNLCAIGEKRRGKGWSTGITNPDKSADEPFVCRVNLKDTSLVTSGDYERYYTVDGVKYHHIIDPETCMPAAYFSSVSVFAADSGLADALSTALFCMSYEDGLALAKELNVEVIWVRPSGEVLTTDGVPLLRE